MTEHDDSTNIFEWTPPSAGATWQAETSMDRVQPLVENRGATADDLVEQLARIVYEWLIAPSSPDAGVLPALMHELAPFFEAHAWRGTVARFGAAIAGVGRLHADDGSAKLREELARECAFWFDRAERQPWSGAPLEAGARVGDKSRCAAPLLDGYLGVAQGETILVHGWSETVVRGLELAHARGLRPEVIVSEGGPDLGGRRLARRLVASGMTVRFVYDAALVESVASADRIWLGTDTIGTRTFIGRVGTRAALQRAHDLDVPSAVIATSDKFVPLDSLALPSWAAGEPWHLWEGAPQDVSVESQSFEEVPQSLVTRFATERGAWSAADAGRLAGTSAVETQRVPDSHRELESGLSSPA